MLSCYGQKLYAIRQPCDYVHFMTRMAFPKTGATGHSDASADADLYDLGGWIFFQSRQILLFPVSMEMENWEGGQEKALKQSNHQKRKRILGIF